MPVTSVSEETKLASELVNHVQTNALPLRLLVEKCLEMQHPAKFNFIDFKAVFVSVHRESLWKILRSLLS